jgi:hypothetical protein
VHDISETNKSVARKVDEAFGRFPKITTMWDADNLSSVDVGAVVDSPEDADIDLWDLQRKPVV